MLSDFKEFILKEKLFLPGERILLAVSGGMDSIVMAELFHRAGFTFGIAHCNFSLRGAESDAEEEFVRELSKQYKAEFFAKRFNTRSYANEKKISVQMAARDLRYGWFEQILSETEYTYVATAHHLDDQIETFIINLSRGTGLAGLHGILPKKGNVIRPLLFTDRKQIERFIRNEKLDYREDSSNRETHYLRNFIRHNIISGLNAAIPGFKENVLGTIENIRQAERIYYSTIDEKSRQLLIEEEGEIRIDKNKLKQLNPLSTWIFEFLKPYGFNPSTCEQIASSLDNEPGRYFHSDTHRLLLDRDHLILIQYGEDDAKDESCSIDALEGKIELPINLEWKQLNPKDAQFTGDQCIAYLDIDKLVFPLQIRKWQVGDYFYPLGMDNRKKLSDFFIDQKMSLLDKEKTWLLCSEGDIAWVIGQRIDDRFKVTRETKRVLRLTFK